MKLPLTLFTDDSLSITQMDTTLSAIDHGSLFLFRFLAVFHLVTSPLICISPLMVSAAADGTINQQPVVVEGGGGSGGGGWGKADRLSPPRPTEHTTPRP